MWVAFANANCKCKSYSQFFSKNIGIYVIFNDQSFNNSVTNDIISFEQLGPEMQSVQLCPDYMIVQANLTPVHIQSTLIISKSKGLYETLRDIRTSTYQICRTEENN